MMARYSTRKSVIVCLSMIYAGVWLFALFNYKARCHVTMPYYATQHGLLNTEGTLGRCIVNMKELGLVPVDTAEDVNVSQIVKDNPMVRPGGYWKPIHCQPWQKVAIIVPYRDRLHHLKILLNRLHPMLQKQKLEYRIFVVEQFGKDEFNKGRIMNIGFVEAIKMEHFDCFIFHDVDIIPENDKNLYLCDENARHLSSAIDEMRYHVMFYNLVGAVIALNRENFKRVNGFSNQYWGWGNEDDDFSARTLVNEMLITRPPESIGRYKMVRHTKQNRATHGYELFSTFRSRMYTDGVNQIDKTVHYEFVELKYEPLYTNIIVDIGPPPFEPEILADAPHESWIWSLWFYMP